MYILTNATRRLYVGVTNDLEGRLHEHKNKRLPGFTAKYNISWLAYYEQTSDVWSALSREKQSKSWRRSKKVALIERANPQWKDLSLEWLSESVLGVD